MLKTMEEASATSPPPPPPQQQQQQQQPQVELQMLLEVCRNATDEQHAEPSSFGALAAYLQEANKHDISTRMAQEQVARSMLTQFSYSQNIDPVLDACGVVVSISTVSIVLKEIASSKKMENVNDQDFPTKVSPQAILENCWKTIQRLLLNSKGNQKEVAAEETAKQNDENRNETSAVEAIHIADRVECQEFVTKIVLLLPQILANACHAAKLQVPLHATTNYFYPRLVYMACRRCQTNQNNNHTLLLAQLLIQTMMQTRRSEFVARGLVKFLESLLSSETSDVFALFLTQLQLSTRDTANLMFVLLQQADSMANDKATTTTTSILQACRSLFQASSAEQQEMIVERLVFSKHTISPEMEPRWSQWVVQIMTPNEGDDVASFLANVTTIAERWSQWTFLQQVDGRQQHHVSLVLWESLKRIIQKLSSDSSGFSLQDQHELTLAIMQGVSQRLESTLTVPRQDGMRIATELAKGLGQEIKFEELENIDEEDGDDGNAEGNKKQKEDGNGRKEEATSSQAADDGDDDDASVEWVDDELVPYDLNDDEEDLAETPKPLQLLEALDLLRTGENHDYAYTRHEAAMNALPELIRSRPDDLPDVAISMALQLLRMEDKFNLDGFDMKRQHGILALLVEEPSSVGSVLIEQLFEDGGLGDRLNILSGLQAAAIELSGNGNERQSLEENKSLQNNPSNLLTKSDAETKALSMKQGIEVLSKTRRKRSRPSQKVIKNKFAPVAPMWFYSMIAGFLKHKENKAIWSGSTGSIFLAHFFRCLATIVEHSGFQASQVLAGDLLDLVWDFRTADVPEVRLSVLVSVATSIAMLPEERIFAVLLQEGSSLPKAISDMSGNDPDKQCRSLSTTIAKSIYEVIQISKE